MRLYIGDEKTRKFKKFFEPCTIDPDPQNGLILYAYDILGRCYVLSFSSREHLVAVMTDLRNLGTATAYCEIYEYREEPQYEYGRELQFDEDLERSY
jgi:hypothetical protein